MKLTEVKQLGEQTRSANAGQRTLFESVLVPEVKQALSDWAKAHVDGAVMIGGVAVSFWGLPRYTSDIDFIFLTASDVPTEVSGFKRIREHAFLHKKTHVEVEVLDPEFLKLPPELVGQIKATAVERDGVKVASPSGLVAAKLFRFSKYDQGDIEYLVQHHDVNLVPYSLPKLQLDRFSKLIAELES